MNIKQNLKKTSKSKTKKSTKQKNTEKIIPKNIIKFQKEAIFLGKIFGTIFLTLSIYSHHYTDPSFNRVSSGTVSNVLGRLGSYSSDIFFQIFGISAYLIPLGIFFYFLKRNFIPTIKPIYFLLQYFLIVSIISSFIGIYTDYNTLYCGFMGILVAPFAVSLLNKVGTYLVLSFMFLVGFITISNIPIISLMYEFYKYLSVKIVNFSANIFSGLIAKYRAWRDKRAEQKEFKQDSKTISDVFDEDGWFVSSSDKKTEDNISNKKDSFKKYQSSKTENEPQFVKSKTAENSKYSENSSKDGFTFSSVNSNSEFENSFDVDSQKINENLNKVANGDFENSSKNSEIFVLSKGFYRKIDDNSVDFYEKNHSTETQSVFEKDNSNLQPKNNEKNRENQKDSNKDSKKTKISEEIKNNTILENSSLEPTTREEYSDSDKESNNAIEKSSNSDKNSNVDSTQSILTEYSSLEPTLREELSKSEEYSDSDEKSNNAIKNIDSNINSDIETDASHLVIETESSNQKENNSVVTPPAIKFKNFELALAELDEEDFSNSKNAENIEKISDEKINIINSIDELDDSDENSSEIDELESDLDEANEDLDDELEENDLDSESRPKLFQNVFDNIDEEEDELEEINQKITIKVAEHRQNIFVDESGDSDSNYELPKLEFLNYEEPKNSNIDEEFLNQNANTIVGCLEDFGVKGCVIKEIFQGPTLTTYELKATKGTRIVAVTKYSDEIASELKVKNVRMVPINEKGVIGVEVPNKIRETVWLKEILASDEYKKQLKKSKLTVVLGKDISGQPVIANLAKMPHLLIAGTTGSGKSVFTNILITSVLYNATADEVKFILIDPKMLEFSMYNEIPNLLFPVITDAKKASHALSWAVDEMERRYKLIADFGEKDILSYNERVEEIIEDAQLETIQEKLAILEEKRHLIFADNTISDQERIDILNDINIEIDNLKTDFEIPEKLPYIVIVLDEYADLMMVAAKEVEISIARIAQKARAAGIHLVIATQRPDKDVVTGIIKANLPVRVALSVKGASNSRIIIDENGAEKLLGQGDMLYMAPGTSDLIRVQSPWISTSEQKKILDFLRLQGSPTYDLSVLDKYDDSDDSTTVAITDDDKDEKFEEALRIAAENKAISASYLQRCLKLGYNRAARIIEIMEKEGIVGPANGSKARPVIKIPEKYLQK
ncbi:DNA translocase FtsK 4TM domain-containing protein [bacterium]|nr:DNA translocase FtsK 4TM domain-containing protein [bacterium]